MLLTLIHLIIVIETVRADIERLPYILSFAEDPKSRDKTHAFVRREASNQDGFNHYALRSLSRASFVDAHDITDHRPFASMNDGTQFYDERRNYAIVRDRELAFGPDEYDPDFYDAVAAQTFDERQRPSTTTKSTVTSPPPTTTTVPLTPTVTPSVPTVTYASFPLRTLFPPLFFNPPHPFFVATTAPPSTVPTTPRSTSPTTTTLASTTTTQTTTTVPTPPPTTVSTTTSTVAPTRPPTTISTTVSPATVPQQPSTVLIESEVMPLLLLKSPNGIGEQRDSPFFRSEVINNPRRFCRDAIFVLDNSGSTKFNFERLKKLIGSLADLVFEDSARKVGMITFSSRHRQRIVYDWIEPRTSDSPRDFHRRLKDLTFAGGITQLGSALAMLQDRLFDESLQRVSRPVDIVLFTDGYSFDDPSIVASNLRLSGHRIYVAALFTSYLRSELDSITGDPSRVVTEMEGLDTLAHTLHTCF